MSGLGFPVFDSYREYLIASIVRELRKEDTEFLTGMLMRFDLLNSEDAAPDEAEHATNNVRLCQNERAD